MASRSVSLSYTPYIHHLTKNVSLLWSYFLFPLIMDCPAPSPKSFGGNPIDRIFSSSKTFLWQKNHPLQIEVFIFFEASVKAVFIAIVVFLSSGFIYAFIMLILIYWWLLKLIFSMTKALNGQTFKNPVSIIPCFPLYYLPFSSQTLCISSDPTLNEIA